MKTSSLLTIAALGAAATAYQLPANLKNIYNAHKAGNCKKPVSSTMDSGTVYCGDLPNAIFLKSNNNYDNLDIDCDGANNGAGDCSNDPSGQGETAFKDTVKSFGISDLNANIHPYIVFGTSNFNPQSHGMEPLSVMAVVCNNQVHYGIWGDTNGFHSTGEASISLGKLCFPNEHLTGDNGHDPKDVLFIGFTGKAAVPGKSGANWKAGSAQQFEDSIKSIGDRLVAALPSA